MILDYVACIAAMDKALRGGYMLCFLDDGEGMMPSK